MAAVAASRPAVAQGSGLTVPPRPVGARVPPQAVWRKVGNRLWLPEPGALAVLSVPAVAQVPAAGSRLGAARRGRSAAARARPPVVACWPILRRGPAPAPCSRAVRTVRVAASLSQRAQVAPEEAWFRQGSAPTAGAGSAGSPVVRAPHPAAAIPSRAGHRAVPCPTPPPRWRPHPRQRPQHTAPTHRRTLTASAPAAPGSAVSDRASSYPRSATPAGLTSRRGIIAKHRSDQPVGYRFRSRQPPRWL